MIKIPTYETERLILRGLRESDLDAFAAMMADDEVARYIGGTIPRPDAWRYIAGMLGHWVIRGYGLWAVERKSDGAFMGRIGLINPEGWPGIEVGWALAKPYWGQGYATEAARVAFTYGFRHTSVPRLISLIHPDNHASRKVAQRLGETLAEKTTIVFAGKTHDVEIWALARPA